MKHKILIAIFFGLGLASLQAQRSLRIQDLLLQYEQLWDALTNESVPLEQRLLYKARFDSLFVKPDSAVITARMNNTGLPLRRSPGAYAQSLLSDQSNAQADLQLSYFYYQRRNPGQTSKHYRVYVHQTIRRSDATIIKTPMVFILNAAADRIISIAPYEDLDMDGVADEDDFCPEIPGLVENGCPKPTFFESLAKPIKDDGKIQGIYLEYQRLYLFPNDSNRIQTNIREGLMSDPVTLPIHIQTDMPEILHVASFGAQFLQLNPPEKVGLVLASRVGLSFYYNSLFRLSSGDLFGGLGIGVKRFYLTFYPIGLRYLSGRIMPEEAGRPAATEDGLLSGSEILVHKLLYMPNVELGYRLNQHHALNFSFTFLTDITYSNEQLYFGGRYFYSF